ncbi:MAG: hypothetical protein IE914_09940 [Thiotrichales bacterium]|nr:hypothetical protein [Thiotrichales bacterium]
MMKNKSRKKASVAAGPAQDMHPADIKCALEKAGWTLRLSLNPWDIWPSRYDSNNKPIRLPMGRRSHKTYRAKHSTKDSEKR